MLGRGLSGLCAAFLVGIALSFDISYASQWKALHKLYYSSFSSKKTEGLHVSVQKTYRLYSQEGTKEKDRISALPDQPGDTDFNQYGGYVTIDMEAGRALFYYFAEAPIPEHSTSPLLLWLNGGPGCSSLGYGSMQEVGPFRVASDGNTLYRNPYAWNRVANVIFLESPAGVGFSYSNNTVDYKKSGDKKTAEDSYVFLLNWMERFPEYKRRAFYIAGESYAGHYVPQLAQIILRHKHHLINLKGIMIGNPTINYETDTWGLMDYLSTHVLVSDETNELIHKHCSFSDENQASSKQCNMSIDALKKDIDMITMDNIYGPSCFSIDVTATPNKPSIENFDPCTYIYVQAYLNHPQVQKALHANVTKLTYPWVACSAIITDSIDSPASVLPIIKELGSNGIRILVYSGDVDSVVPVTSTLYSLRQLKLPINRKWKAWMANNEVGGYSFTYDKNITFATVRGAGHEVPSFQPAKALVLVEHFLQGIPLTMNWV